jgi:hypothetical protein
MEADQIELDHLFGFENRPLLHLSVVNPVVFYINNGKDLIHSRLQAVLSVQNNIIKNIDLANFLDGRFNTDLKRLFRLALAGAKTVVPFFHRVRD